MRRLEERLGVQLLARSARSVSTTQAGERLLARLNPAMGEISRAVEELGASAGRPSGHIRISAPGEAARRMDAGIRLGESLEKDVVAVPVTGPLRMAVIAAPQYLKKHGIPRTPRDLRAHRCINLRLASAGTLYKWEFERGTEKIDVAVDGPLVFDSGGMVLDAVRQVSPALAAFVEAVRIPSKPKAGTGRK